MESKRLSINLRVRENLGEDFLLFLKERQQSRELSALIQDLLYLYFRNEGSLQEVHAAWLEDTDPYLEITREVKRMKLQVDNLNMESKLLAEYAHKVGQGARFEEPVDKAPKTDDMSKLAEEVTQRVVAQLLSQFGGMGNAEKLQKAAIDVEEGQCFRKMQGEEENVEPETSKKQKSERSADVIPVSNVDKGEVDKKVSVPASFSKILDKI